MFFPVVVVAIILEIFTIIMCAAKVSQCSSSFLKMVTMSAPKDPILRRQIWALSPFGLKAHPLKWIKSNHWLSFMRAASDYTIAVLELFKH